MKGAICKVCKKKVWQNQISEDRICSTCAPRVSRDIAKGAEFITANMDKAFNVESVSVKLKLYERIINRANELMLYEKMKLPVMNPAPSFIADYYTQLKKSLVEGQIHKEITSMMERLTDEQPEKASLADLSRLRLKILKYRDAADYYNIPFRKHLKNFIDKIATQELVYQGAKYRHNGQINSALSIYRRALNHLLTDDIPDSLQAKDIKYLQTRIATLKKQVRKKANRA